MTATATAFPEGAAQAEHDGADDAALAERQDDAADDPGPAGPQGHAASRSAIGVSEKSSRLMEVTIGIIMMRDQHPCDEVRTGEDRGSRGHPQEGDEADVDRQPLGDGAMRGSRTRSPHRP